jgi:hypothetical protein
MTINNKIAKQKQIIARCEKTHSIEQLKKRRADTRRKIEFGGLVIKSGMDAFNKSTILGALNHALELIEQNPTFKELFENRGDVLFLN